MQYPTRTTGMHVQAMHTLPPNTQTNLTGVSHTGEEEDVLVLLPRLYHENRTLLNTAFACVLKFTVIHISNASIPSQEYNNASPAKEFGTMRSGVSSPCRL